MGFSWLRTNKQKGAKLKGRCVWGKVPLNDSRRENFDDAHVAQGPAADGACILDGQMQTILSTRGAIVYKSLPGKWGWSQVSGSQAGSSPLEAHHLALGLTRGLKDGDGSIGVGHVQGLTSVGLTQVLLCD